MRWFLSGLAMLAGLAGGAPAQAAWHEATTRHFIVYADDTPRAVQRLADDLERFDKLVRYYQKRADVEGADANKLTIYVVPDVAALQDLCKCSNAAGFYVGRASGSIAFTPKRSGQGGVGQLSPRIVLFHEYGHHFLLGAAGYAFPQWFSEGYAEFVSTAQLKEETAHLGYPAMHRGWDLLMENKLPLERLFDPPKRRTDWEVGQLYARGWLLTHYLLLTPGGLDKLNTYLTAFNTGTPSVAAATAAFGDLKALDKALDRYLKGSLNTMVIQNTALPVEAARIRALRPGEAAMIRLRMESTRGVDQTTAAKVYARAAPVAKRFPDDAVVQGWFAEMATDAGYLDVAEGAADRALAIDPDSAQALLYKSRVLQARASQAKASDAATWAAARKPLLAANKLSTDHAAVLEAFYLSYMAQGAPPSPGARAGLYRAQELAPQDMGLRFLAARQRLIDGNAKEAERLLRPLAYNPHGGGEHALALLRKLEGGASAKQVLADMDTAEKEAEKKGAQKGDE